MRRIMKVININKHLTPHHLRHTHTSLLAEAGVELPEIMARLGHKIHELTTMFYLYLATD